MGFHFNRDPTPDGSMLEACSYHDWLHLKTTAKYARITLVGEVE